MDEPRLERVAKVMGARAADRLDVERVAAGVLVPGVLDHRPEPAAVIAPILGDLSADELTEVFDSLSIEAPVHETVAVGFEDLNEAQLQELLRLMEG